MSDRSLYVVRGTGFPIDGCIVEIVSTIVIDGIDFYTVKPFGRNDVNVNSFLIDNKFLSKANDMSLLSYRITITKTSDDGSVESTTDVIDKAARNISIDNLLNRIIVDLTPIVRI